MGWRFNPFTGNFDFVDTVSGGSPDIWDRLTGNVATTVTSAVDTIPLNSFDSVKYIVSFSNNTNDEVKQLEFGVINLDSSLKDSVYGKIKGNLNIDVDAVINGSDFEFQITNNEAFTINYNIAKVLFN